MASFSSSINTIANAVYGREVRGAIVDALQLAYYNPAISQGNSDEIKYTVNVKDYGAAGDGQSDDTQAIKNAVKACQVAGGGTIYFPSGTYWLSSAVTVSSNIKLQGDANTVLTAEPPDNSYRLRNCSFLNIGSNTNQENYNGFSNVEINSIIFDLGSTWSIDSSGKLTFTSKYDSRNTTYPYCLGWTCIVAANGDGLTIRNCTFRNGVYTGYTSKDVVTTDEHGNKSTVYKSSNPHVMDLGGVKNLLIEGCTFEPLFSTASGMVNWVAGMNDATGHPEVNYSDVIQLDCAESGGGGGNAIWGDTKAICRDVIIRNNKFCGLPYFDWSNVENNTVDFATGNKIKDDIYLRVSNGKIYSYAKWRFAKYSAIGANHTIDKSEYQAQNVEIYDNIFENSWASHYATIQPYESLGAEFILNEEDGCYYPSKAGFPYLYEPARIYCHGAIYAYPGSKGYNIHHNTFKENLSADENISTAVFLYGSECGIVHDNTFINYGQPLPMGNKSEKISADFSTTDEWSSSKTGYYNGIKYCKSSNNLWIKDGEEPRILNSGETERVYNVLNYGMDNTGQESVNAVLNTIVKEIRANGGGTIYFPSGKYWFSDRVIINSNTTIQGDTNTVFTAEPPNNSYMLRTAAFLAFGEPYVSATTDSNGKAHYWSADGWEIKEYNGFTNCEINSIIFDLGGSWNIDSDGKLTFKGKFDSRFSGNPYTYGWTCINGAHGDGLRIKNCTFRNGVHIGLTGKNASGTVAMKINGEDKEVTVSGANPHIMDVSGIKNILIEGCTFEPLLITPSCMANWTGILSGAPGALETNLSDLLQLDPCYGDGGSQTVKMPQDGTICRDVVIRNNKFYGMPYFDWENVDNQTTDFYYGDKVEDWVLYGTKKLNVNETTSYGNTYAKDTVFELDLTRWRFGAYPAIGCCHDLDRSEYQAQNVQIYDNYFEGGFGSHYQSENAYKGAIVAQSYDDGSVKNGKVQPVIDEYYEPAAQYARGAIYAYPGAKDYNIYNNTFRETKAYDENKSTAVFLYGSECGIVHDNTFINYGQPLPVGEKSNTIAGDFSETDEWSSSKTGWYNGVKFCKSSNNLWIRDGKAPTVINSSELEVYSGEEG